VAVDPPNKLNDDQRLEYQEIGQFVRHDDTVNLTMSSLLVPALLLALSYAWQHHDLEGPLALASLVLWAYWIVAKRRRNDFLSVRLRRAWIIEESAGLDHHLRIRQADRDQGPMYRLVRINRAERFGSAALFLAWIWLIFAPIFTLLLVLLLAVVAIVAIAPELTRESMAEVR
jgi:hypothetical protein